MPQDRDQEPRSSLDDKYEHRMYNRGDEEEEDLSRETYSRRRDRPLTGGSSRPRSRSRSRSPYRRSSERLQSESTANKCNNNNNKTSSSSGIQMKLLATPTAKPADNKPSGAKKLSVASVFNEDDDEEPEEMPCYARMRMKNVGRETPTSAGPNSFGKTKIGFCNVTHITEKKHNL